MLSAENLLEKIPVLAISGDDSAVDSILYETLRVLLKGVDAKYLRNEEQAKK